MTTDEFIAELKERGIKFKYVMHEGVAYNFRTEKGFCPICALLHDRGIDEIALDNSSARILGETYLGLDGMDVAFIITAADAYLPCGEAFEIKKKLEKLCYAQS